MSADFSVTVDSARNMLDVRMAGFFTVADVERYGRGIATASSRLTGRPADQVVLCDITAMKIQTQDVVDAFAGVMADPRYAGRRVALVVTASLARMQAQRATAMAHRESRIFTDRDQAEAWLFGRQSVAA